MTKPDDWGVAPVSGGLNRLMTSNFNRIGSPQICFAPPNEDGTPTEAERIASEKAAADKAAADKAAADKAAADQAAAEAEARRKAGISDKEAELLKENMDKKAKLKAANDELEKIKKQLADYDGLDPAELKKLVADKKDAEKAALEAKGEFGRLKDMMAEEHKKEITKAREEAAATKAALDGAMVQINDLTIGAAFNTSGYVTDTLVLTPAKARTVYGSHFEIDNGQIIAYDKPKGAASRTKLVDSSGNPLAFEAAVKKIVEADPDRDHIVKSKLKPGAGSKGSEGTPSDQEVKGLTGLARIQAALAAQVKK